MIEALKQKIAAYDGTVNDKYNYLRELLQLTILKKIDTAGYFQKIAFVGGTALRILFDLNRFSEALDFSLIDPINFDFTKFVDKLMYELKLDSLVVEQKTKLNRAVCSIQLKFKNILFDTGLSPHKDAVIMIKLEIDCNPPAGYNTELSLIQKGDMIAVNHFDLPSLFAGKLHAILQRKYTKGRDYYDFLWYQGRGIKPNLTLLNNALTQTMGSNQNIDNRSLEELLRKRFNETDYTVVKRDLEAFLSDPQELRFFTKEMFLSTLKSF